MKEGFPTNVRPGQRLTNGWVNDVGRVCNRDFATGSSSTGVRFGPFGADISDERLVVKPVLVTRFVNEETGDPEELAYLPDVTLEVGAFYRRRYQCKMLRFTEVSFADGDKAYEPADDDTDYIINTYWLEEQFLLPGNTAYVPGEGDVESDGDKVLAVWDGISGEFFAVQPPTSRLGKVSGEPNTDGSCFVKVYRNDPTKPANRTGIAVQALNPFDLEIFEDDVVFLEYTQSLRRWIITQVKSTKLATHIHFTLTTALAAGQPHAEISVERWYEGKDPTPEDSVALLVYNPEAGCTGTTYRFFGPAGCKGQAIYSKRDSAYWIWQLDCQAV